MGFILTVAILIILIVSAFVINKVSKNVFFTKCGVIIEKVSISKLFFPILIAIVFVFSFIFYTIFSLPLGSPEIELFKVGASSSFLSEAATIAKAFVKDSNTILTSVFGWIVVIASIVLIIYLKHKNKLTFKWLLFLTLLVGSLVRLVYANTTDAIFTRQHDVWSSSGYGHYGITMNIFYEWVPLPLREVGGVASLDFSYQLYHPKFAHYCYAIVMHFNSIFFGNDAQWTLYQSIRIFTSALSIISLLIVHQIFKEITPNKNVILVGTLFFAFSPLFLRLSAMTNNDPVLYFFMILSVLFIIKFYKNQTIFNVIMLAISVGLAMASKLSGALIAVPVAIVLLITLINFIKERNLKKIFILFPIFAIIVFPLGLFWPFYNYVNYDQPLTYVFSNLNQALLIDSTKYSYFSRLISLNPIEYFNNVWMRLWNSNGAPIDYNLYTSMIKSSIFGEFSYMDGGLVFAIILYIANFLFILGGLGLIVIRIFETIKQKNYFPLILVLFTTFIYLIYIFVMSKELPFYLLAVIFVGGLVYLIYLGVKNKVSLKENIASILFAGIFLIFMISYASLQISHPYTCSQDFRYIGLFVLVGSYFFSTGVFNTQKKEIRTILLVIMGLYCFSSMGLYISLGF